ncbi:MAG: helix-turn-helix transcriptional regulator [Mesorhizobium sp.]|nr:helix-turn-helix transcriptional regulator [Mesorhizobium sp.]MCO5162746.1 helix-turn-helix transcriptional regulator [Mesorhizobium sp.]
MLLDYAPPDIIENTATAVDGSRYFRAPAPGRIVRRSESGLALVMLSEDPARDAASSARAVLSNDASADLVAAATRLAAAGYTVRKAGGAERRTDPPPAFEPQVPMSQREREVLALLAEGASNKVIARRLDISVHTAKFHVAAVCTKLKARNRTDAVSIALREGVLGT